MMTLRNGILALSLSAVFGLWGCGSNAVEPTPPAKEEPPDEEPPEEESEPSWDGKAPREAYSWKTPGDIYHWRTGRLGTVGEPAVVFAGNSFGAVADDGTLLWKHGAPGGLPLEELILDVSMIDKGDGTHDVLATTVGEEAMLLDGRDGSVLWSEKLEYPDGRRAELVVFGEEDDPLFLSIFGDAVHSVKSGKERWRHDLPSPPIWAQPIRQEEGAPMIVFGIDRGWERTEAEPDLFAYTLEGQQLFEVSSERFLTHLSAAKLGNDASESLLVGTNDARLSIFSSDGELRWAKSLTFHDYASSWLSYVARSTTVDVDGDGRSEIFVTMEREYSPTLLIALDQDGNELWNVSFEQRIPLLDWISTSDGIRLVAAFPGSFVEHGAMVLIDPLTGTTSRQIPGQGFLSGGAVDREGARIFMGFLDGRGRFVKENGAADGSLYVGHKLLYAYGVEDGALSLDSWGTLAASREPGDVAWHVSFDPSRRTRTGECVWLEEDGEALIAVSGMTNSGASPVGGLHFLSPTGEKRQSLVLDRLPTAIAATDLDGDGVHEMVTVHPAMKDGDPCVLSAYGRDDFRAIWTTKLSECWGVWVHAGDVDGEGKDAIAVTSFAQGKPSFVALVDGAGGLRWMEHFSYLPYWTLALPGGVVVGGVAEDGHGFAHFHDGETGTQLWTTRLPYKQDPADPTSGSSAFAFYGTRVGDRNGDGRDEVALTTAAGEVHLLDGATGEILWTRPIREEGTSIGGGPIAWIPATEKTPSFLLVTEQGSETGPTVAAVFSSDGDRKGEVPVPGNVASASLSRGEGGEWKVGLAAEFGLTVVEVR